MQGVSELRGVATSIVLVSTFPTPPLSQLFLHSVILSFPVALKRPSLIKLQDSVHCPQISGQYRNQPPSWANTTASIPPPPHPLLNPAPVSTLTRPSTPRPER